MNFASHYKKFLDNAKTKRETINIIEDVAIKHGFKDFSKLKQVKITIKSW